LLESQSCWDRCGWTTTGKLRCPRLPARLRSGAPHTPGLTQRMRTHWRRHRVLSESFLLGSGFPQRAHDHHRRLKTTYPLHGRRRWLKKRARSGASARDIPSSVIGIVGLRVSQDYRMLSRPDVLVCAMTIVLGTILPSCGRTKANQRLALRDLV